MLKRLPSRNQRSKGIRAKHVLQICLLLGICFWLIYQVKHSHDKKKEFDESDVKTSLRRASGSEVTKLGRKDLLPREDVTRNEKPEEEEEEETPVEEELQQHEEEREEEENKNDAQEQDEEENKNEEAEDGGRGGGDDEIDENDQEKKDEEGNRDEDFIDEEKEREEAGDDEIKTNVNEDMEDQFENENTSEDQDNDGGDRSDHEAREEHYIRDDASSEVAHEAHNTQVVSTGTEKTSSENSNENLETKNLEQENKSHNTEDVNKNASNAGSVMGEGGTAENHTSLDMISFAQKVDNNSTNSVDNQVLLTTQSNDQPEASNNLVQVSTEVSNNSAVVSTEASKESSGLLITEARYNSAEIRNEFSDSSQQNKVESVSDSGDAQKGTMDGTNTGESRREETSLLEKTNNSSIDSEDNKDDSNSTVSTKTENADGAFKQFSDSPNGLEIDATGKIVRPEETTQVEDGSKENIDAFENEKSDNKSDTNGAEEGSDFTTGTEDAIQHDPIDFSDTQIAQEMKDVSTDLETLPDSRSQRDEIEEIAAE